MKILQQVEVVVIFMPYFRSIDRYAYCVWLLPKYEAHMKGLPICFSEVSVRNDVTDYNNKHFVTAFEGECRNIIELREHLKLCFLIILVIVTSYTLIYTHAQLRDCEASRKAYGLSSFARYQPE